MIIYTAVFYIYTFKKSVVIKQIFCLLFFLAFVISYTYIEDDSEALYVTLGKNIYSFLFSNIILIMLWKELLLTQIACIKTFL